MNKYLVPMYRHINGNEENHLVLIEADTKYQSLLTALSIYECNDAPTNYHPNETWTVDMNTMNIKNVHPQNPYSLI